LRRKSACAVCGKSTLRLLLNDTRVNIPICSYKCELRYLDTISSKEQATLLTIFDERITQTKHSLRLCWTTAAVGVAVILAGLLTKNAAVFLAGASLAILFAFLIRYFEEKTVKLTNTRKRISI
jgi:hypothetical protein